MIQAYVFCILFSGYLKDSVELHSSYLFLRGTPEMDIPHKYKGLRHPLASLEEYLLFKIMINKHFVYSFIYNYL